jgi:hypothetical protein
MIKLKHKLHPNTQYVSTLTGEQYKIKNPDVYKLGSDIWRPHKGIDIANGYFIPVEEYLNRVQRETLAPLPEATHSTPYPFISNTSLAKINYGDIEDCMTTNHLRRQPYIMEARAIVKHAADEINLRGTATGRFTTQAHTPLFKEDTMSTFTAESLEARINPVPKADSTYQSVKALEKENELAANGVIVLASMLSSSETYTVSRSGNAAQIPEKYLNLMNSILRDMRKDQEVILDTTAATLVKVQKVIS